MHLNQSLRSWIQGVGVACALLGAQHVHAQGVPKDVAQQVPTEQVNLHYQSLFLGYQRHADSRMESWPKSNQTVQEIGGWKAYAKEPSGSTVDPKDSAHQSHSMPLGHAHGEHK